MEKEIVVKYEAEETMVAVMEEQQLAEIYFEREEKHRFMGNIYWGIVETVLPGMQAACMNMGEEKDGF